MELFLRLMIVGLGSSGELVVFLRVIRQIQVVFDCCTLVGRLGTAFVSCEVRSNPAFQCIFFSDDMPLFNEVPFVSWYRSL